MEKLKSAADGAVATGRSGWVGVFSDPVSFLLCLAKVIQKLAHPVTGINFS
jgi:hypothetical protein